MKRKTLPLALLALLTTAFSLVAQTLSIDVKNTGDVGIIGVKDVAVPIDLVPRGKAWTGFATNGAAFIAVPGRSFGPSGHGFTELTLFCHEWPAGGARVKLQPSKLRATPANWRAHPLVGDNPADLFPSVTIRGIPIEWDLFATHVYTNALKRVFTITGRTRSGPQVSSRIEITVGANVPYFAFEGEVVYSDLANPKPLLELNKATEVQVHFRENALFSRRVEDSIRVDGDEHMHAAASYAFAGRVLAQPQTAEEIAAYTPKLGEEPPKPNDNVIQWPKNVGQLLGRLDASQWQGHVLVHGRIVAQDDAAPPERQPKNWRLPSGWSKTANTGPRQVDRPAQTGGRDVFGTFPGQEAFYCDLELLPSLVVGTYEEAVRAIHHRDAAGLPVDVRDHPNCLTYNSLPDPRATSWGVPQADVLSFGGGIQEARLRVQDESHVSHAYTFLAEMLGGSAVARWTREAQTEMFLASLDWYAQIQRAAGRVLKCLGYSWCLSDAETRGRIEAFVTRKLDAVVRRIEASQIPADAVVFPGYIDRNKKTGYPRYLAPDWTAAWSGFQQALLADGVVLVWNALKPELLSAKVWEQQRRICRTVVQWGYFESDAGQMWPFYTVGWQEDGSPILNPVDNVNVQIAASVRPFRLTMAVCAVVTNYHDPSASEALKERARRILNTDCCDWNYARWVAPFLE